MTASKTCKALTGLKLTEVHEITGKPLRTLYDCFVNNRVEFIAICYGAAEIKRQRAKEELDNEQD